MFIQPNTITLEWPAGHPLADLAITMRSASIEQMEAVEKLTVPDAMDAMAQYVVGWNLESAPGETAPVGRDALRALSPAIGKALVHAWMQTVWGATLPLDSTGESGDGLLSPDSGDTAPQTLGLASQSVSLPS